MSAPRRTPLLPDVPTSAEAGMPELLAVNWFAVLVPAKTPRPVIDRLYAALIKTANSPDIREKLLNVGVEIMTQASPEAHAARSEEHTLNSSHT